MTKISAVLGRCYGVTGRGENLNYGTSAGCLQDFLACGIAGWHKGRIPVAKLKEEVMTIVSISPGAGLAQELRA